MTDKQPYLAEMSAGIREASENIIADPMSNLLTPKEAYAGSKTRAAIARRLADRRCACVDLRSMAEEVKRGDRLHLQRQRSARPARRPNRMAYIRAYGTQLEITAT